MNTTSLRLLSATVLYSVVITSCIKERNTSSSSPSANTIQAAKDYFDNNVGIHPPSSMSQNHRALASRSLQWQNAYIAQLSVGPAVIVPMRYNSVYVTTDASAGRIFALSDIARLILYRDSKNQFHSRVITYIPDSATKAEASQFTGTAFYEDWQGNSVTKPWHLAHSSKGPGQKQVDVMAIEVCTTTYGYNYAEDDPDNGESWSETSCNVYSFAADDGGGGDGGGGLGSGDIGGIYGGGGGGAGFSGSTIQIPPPKNPIGNISDYLKCYTNHGGDDYTYTVTLAVEQPVPGTREPWAWSNSSAASSTNPFDVGHTWLIMSESTISGTITRNVGFYPAGAVTPFSPVAQGILNDDEATPYNVALTVHVTGSQFFNMLNYISQGNNSGYMYNLNANNCTSFALHALAAGDVLISSKTGSWYNGGGYDPGDLGQDLQSMQISTGMALTTANGAHPNVGSCY